MFLLACVNNVLLPQTLESKCLAWVSTQLNLGEGGGGGGGRGDQVQSLIVE